MKRVFRMFFVLCLCVLTLCGCSFRLPVLVPDNKTVTNLLSDFLSDQDCASGSYEMSYSLRVEDKTTDYAYSGVVSGSRDRISYLSVKRKDGGEADYYFDVSKDLLYRVSDDSSETYSSGSQAVDAAWFQDQLDVGGFKYSGKTRREGKGVFLLDRTYSGTALSDLIAHLHVPLPGTVQTSDSDMSVELGLDRFTGRLYSVSVKSSDTGRAVRVVSDNGVKSELLSFSFELVLDSYGDQHVVLPGSCGDLEPLELPVSLYAGRAGTAGFVKDDCLISEDGLWILQYGEHPVFDDICPQDDGSLRVAPSEALTGDPSLLISYQSGLGAYDSAVSDSAQALDYYGKHGFSEIHVDTDVVQFSVDGYPAYYFSEQYTETEFSYVYQAYTAYVELSDDLSLKFVLSGMTDRGSNSMLNDMYLRSVLDAVSIDRVKN